MKWFSVFACVTLIGLGVMLILPNLSAHREYLSYGVIGMAILALVASLLGARKVSEPERVQAAAPAMASKGPQAEADVLTFLGLLQEKGRLIDFLMDDVTSYSDAQVGAAARVVHQGCKTVLDEHCAIEPVCTEAEGTVVALPEGYSASDFQLTGNVTGEPPFEGTLIHQGWRSSKVKLPRVLESDSLPNIAPAQIELS